MSEVYYVTILDRLRGALDEVARWKTMNERSEEEIIIIVLLSEIIWKKDRVAIIDC
jgi:hypothetical protein